jgi:hypothetical protein
MMPPPSVTPIRLLKLRLVVDRPRGIKAARGRNRHGLLRCPGAIRIVRAFPRRHCFTQAHVAFVITRGRSNPLVHPPGCMVLWQLTTVLNNQCDEYSLR